VWKRRTTESKAYAVLARADAFIECMTEHEGFRAVLIDQCSCDTLRRQVASVVNDRIYGACVPEFVVWAKDT
jgi:hypothetical protein